ncbi:hypothetical protein [Pantanalinema sp. GBBB05]|uniref:hypothetical protein n=1 Tax=Pantanalinema sp. GBBB05 TaxID=2604139 RepID=UPI003D818A4C
MNNQAVLPHSDRATLLIRREIKELVQRARKPHEHNWQTYERLLLAGLESEAKQESAA